MKQKLVEKEKNVTFVGRLGTYRYLDMDAAILEAMRIVDYFLDCRKQGNRIPVFSNDPVIMQGTLI